MLATVVAPWTPVATTCGRSRTLTLRMPAVGAEQLELVVGEPDVGRPLSTAIVAGTAPPSRTICSTSRAIATFCGYGIPWLMIVDSRATTGGAGGQRLGDLRGDLEHRVRRGGVWWSSGELLGRRAGWGSGGPRRARR